MKALSLLTVRQKLGLAFVSVLLLMTALGAMAWHSMSALNEQTDKILTYRVSGVRDAGAMLSVATRLRTREYRVAVSKPDEVETSIARYEASVEEFKAIHKQYAAFLLDDRERQLDAAAMQACEAYMQRSRLVLAAAREGRHEEAVSLTMQNSKAFDAVAQAITALTKYNDDGAKADASAALALYESSRRNVVLTLLAAIGVAVGLGLLIARAITRPLEDAVSLAEAVAAGDLTRNMQAEGRDEIAQLCAALGSMVARLRSVVSEVRNGVESVSTASAQIATGNIDLSQRTEEQASNLQQTAASMEELTSTVQQNADSARAASQLAQGARDVAAHGGQVVADVVSTMTDISDSSRRIADIIGVIDGIAFQTNILALNAAVEAARAGEQGRGFAVVAGEVRTLAQRSAQAAKEIKTLIEQSVEKVDSGARLVGEAGKTMNDIVMQVQRVNDLVGEISSASQEQSRGISQVGDAVAQLDQVTQQNAALVEESAAAAESMKHQAAKLAEVVSVFRVAA